MRRQFWMALALAAIAAWLWIVLRGFGAPYAGVAVDRGRVAAVERGGPADRAGLRPGDQLAPGTPGVLSQGSRPGLPIEFTVLRHGSPVKLRLVPTGLPPSEIAWSSTLALACLAMLGLGLWVWARRPGIASALFLALSFCLAVLVQPSTTAIPGVPPWAIEALSLIATAGFPAFLLHFFLVFPPGHRPAPRLRTLALVYLPAATLLAISLAVVGLQHLRPETSPRAVDLVQSGLTLYFFGALVVAAGLFARTYRGASTAVARSRLRVALLGTVLGFLPPALVSALLIWIPLERLPGSRYAGLSLLLVPLAFADGAVRHRVFDFEVVIKRSLVYSTLIALSLAVYALLAQVVGRWLAGTTQVPEFLWSGLAVFTIGMLFSPLRDRVSGAVDRMFLTGLFDYRSELLRLTHALTECRTLEYMEETAFDAMAGILELRQLAFFERTGPSGLRLKRSLVPMREARSEMELPESAALSRARSASLWDQDAAHASGLAREACHTLEALQACVLVPLRAHEALLGLWVLGPRPRGPWYSPQDLSLLTSLADQCSHALERARMEREAQGQATLKRELEVAHHLQRLLIPERSPIYPTLDLASESLACDEVGGDYFDFVPHGDHRFGFVVADSTGKGVPAALLMAGMQAQFRAEAVRHPEPSEMLGLLNMRVAPHDDPHRYIAAFYAVVDVAKRRIRYANGGHPPPILVHSDGTLEHLDQGGLLLGVSADAEYEEEVRDLRRGDLLVFYTDGVVEERRDDELFGEERLEALLVSRRHLRAQRLVREIIEEVQRFTCQPLQDDLTVVAMKFL